MDLLNRFGSQQGMNNGEIVVNSTEIPPEDLFFAKIEFSADCILLAVGVLVNLLLIIAIRKSPRLKYPIFQLLFALAFADLTLLVAYALPVIGDHITGGIWMFGHRGCTLLVFLQYLPAHVTSCLIVLCCGERFYAVCRPHSALWITTRKMSGIIAVTWLVNAGVLAPLIVMTSAVSVRYPGVGDKVVTSCHLEMPADIRKLYFTVMGMLFYGITTVISAAFLACTYCKVRHIDTENFFIKDDFKNHILRCIGAISIVTVILWLPYRYLYFYNLHLGGDSSGGDSSSSSGLGTRTLDMLSTIMILTSGCIKPFIYMVMSSQFRKSLFRALKCCSRDSFDYEEAHCTDEESKT